MYTLTYFPLWAKGPAAALALAHSGLPWRGASPQSWPALKPTTVWSKLPQLATPSGLTIGHESAILNHISRAVPAMGGESEPDFATSQQLIYECEDIYAKLTKRQPTIRKPSKCPPEQVAALWSRDADASAHNLEQGLHVSLRLLDAFAGRCAEAAAGKLTAGGASVGECKLFSTLHALVLIEPGVLRDYSALTTFYETFGALPATREVVATGGEMSGPFQQYFVGVSK